MGSLTCFGVLSDSAIKNSCQLLLFSSAIDQSNTTEPVVKCLGEKRAYLPLILQAKVGYLRLKF
jgi:hypothetical protein